MVLRALSVNKKIYKEPITKSSGDSASSPQKKGMDLELFLAPSDIPEAIYSSYNKKKDCFEIGFKYINQEKEKLMFENENVCFYIGVQSGKPLRIEINNIKRENIDNIKLTNIIKEDVTKWINENIARVTDERKATNLKYAEKTLQENAELLTV